MITPKGVYMSLAKNSTLSSHSLSIKGLRRDLTIRRSCGYCQRQETWAILKNSFNKPYKYRFLVYIG